MRRTIAGVVVLAALLQGCTATKEAPDVRTGDAIESVHTGLDVDACERTADRSDPNETPYLACPGVAGYSLLVRLVEAGRQSIDVVDPAGRAHPLAYQEFVTRHMSTVDGPAEWRVRTDGDSSDPVALIVRVQAREDEANPEIVTRTYLAVAKLTPGETCVTDRIPDGTEALAEARRVADTARERPCAPAQPSLTGNGAANR